MQSNTASSSTGESNFLFGWDLLFKTVENDIKTKRDVVLALLHFMLIRHGNFKCCGVGEDKTFTEEDAESCSELLPQGWNADDEKFALRYACENKLYILLAYKSEDSLIVNFISADAKKISNLVLEPEIEIKKLKGKIEDIFSNNNLLAQRVKKEIIEPMVLTGTNATSTQTATNNPQRALPEQSQRPPDRDPLRIYDPRAPFGDDRVPFGIADPRFPEVGRGDLDPLGRLGPGNILPFPTRPDFPGSGRPRFDPFGPPDNLARRDPDPDHFPPPGFGGNYFS